MRRFLPVLALLPAFLVSQAGRAEEGIPPEKLNELKAATVYVKVQGEGWAASGSGFLMQVDGETGLVATNHHVIADLLNKPSAKVTLVFWSGTKKEKVLSAEVVTSDPDRDLAILKVTSKDLPKSIDLSQKVELRETMTIYTLGFPLGDLLSTTKGNPAMTIGKGTVSSIREDERGKLKVVQLDGELNPGNSGGPVTDAEGKLVGIAVAKIRGTKISFAIPPGELTAMLNGRISAFAMEVKSADSGVVELELDVRTIDPLKKISKITIRHIRKDAVKESPKPDKDGVFAELAESDKTELKIDGQKAVARLTLTNLEKKKSDYLFQPVYVDGEGKTVALEPVTKTIDFSKSVVLRPTDPPGNGSGSGSWPGSGEIVVTPPPNIGAPTGKDFQLAFKLPRFLAAQLDPKSGTLFLTTPDGMLKHYTYPDFKFKGDYPLPDGLVAYQAALDAPGGLLYVAVTKRESLGGLHGRGDDRPEGKGHILAFEIMHIIDKKGDPGTELKAATEFNADAVVRGLTLAPDGKSLYFMDCKKDDNVTLVRINTKTKKFDGELKLVDKTETMVLTADGKTIYATASPKGHKNADFGPYTGIIQKIDPAEMKLVKKATIAADPANVAADNDGHVFIAGGSGQHTEITVVDMKETYSAIGHWRGVYERAWIALSPDGNRLYISTRGLSPSSMQSWLIPSTIDDTLPSERASCWDSDKAPVGGCPYISPDGKCLLTPLGAAFWTAAAKGDK